MNLFGRLETQFTLAADHLFKIDANIFGGGFSSDPFGGFAFAGASTELVDASGNLIFQSFGSDVLTGTLASGDYILRTLFDGQAILDPFFVPGTKVIANFDINGGVNLHLQQVPEPSTFALLGIGLAAVGLSRRRKNRS